MNACKRIVLILLSIIANEVVSRPHENVEMMALRRRMDQDKAASYSYRIDNNGPAQVYYLSGDDLNRNFHHYSAPLVYYNSKPVTYAPNYYHNTKPKINLPFKPSPVDNSKDLSSASSSSEESNESGLEHQGKSYDSDESKDFSSEVGKSHDDKYHKKTGQTDSEGYNKEFKFHKARKGSHDKELDSGKHSEEGKTSDKKYDEADKYHEHEEAENHKKGGKYNSKKHHKKGSKSKGYHNVFMKDEYKKDHTFYDTADHQGQYSKHGSEHKKHHDNEAENKKKSHYDSASYDDHKSKKGGTDKGHYDHEDEGYKKKSGHTDKFSHHEKYGKHGAKDHSSEHGSHH